MSVQGLSSTRNLSPILFNALGVRSCNPWAIANRGYDNVTGPWYVGSTALDKKPPVEVPEIKELC